MADHNTSGGAPIPKILVIDDEKRIREACCSVLTEEGFVVDIAADGNKGLELIQKGHYDIVLLALMTVILWFFPQLSLWLPAFVRGI